MKLKDIQRVFEESAPFALQEGFDNSGIQFGHPDTDVTKGLVCIDITEVIIDEAISKGCDLIISHHPILFGGLKSITGKDGVERSVIKAIKNDICLFSVHTNLDSVVNGVNYRFAEKLGLQSLKILDVKKDALIKLIVFCPGDHAESVRSAIFAAGAGKIGEYDCCSFNVEGTGSFRAGDASSPFVGTKGELHYEPEVRIETILPYWLQDKVCMAMQEVHPYEEVAYDIYPLKNSFDRAGMGVVGEIAQSMDERSFLAFIKDELSVECIRHNDFTGNEVKRVALCGGSGSFLRKKAFAAGADVFLTADVKYHEFFDFAGQMMILDVGHYESEQFTKEILYEIVAEKFTNFALLISDQSTNPVRYY